MSAWRNAGTCHDCKDPRGAGPGACVMSADCVGFADCPCQRCRHARVDATAAHAEHSTPDLNYCGACRTAERERHYAGPSATLLRSVTRSQRVVWSPETGWTL